MIDQRKKSARNTALDGIDILLLFILIYLATWVAAVTEIRLGFIERTVILSALVSAPIALRTFLWPRPAQLGKKRRTFLGGVILVFFALGIFLGAMGGFWLTTLPTEPRPVDELAIRALVQKFADPPPPVKVVEAAEPAASSSDELAASTGTSEPSRRPSGAAISAYEAQQRALAKTLRTKEFLVERGGGIWVSQWLGGIGLVLIGLGAWLERKRGAKS